jgi:hypothetical protein
MTEHVAITDPQIHEPKGISTAAAGTVYKANGSGSGTWVDITAAIKNKNLVPVTIRIDNLTTAGSTWIASLPIAAKIAKINVVLFGSIGTANGTITSKINGVAVTNGAVTLTYSGSVAGSVFTATPTANNSVAANGAIELVNAGTSTGAVAAHITLWLDVT